jgi:uncharacterized protein (DUF1499 family)
MAAFAGFGSRLHLWQFRTGFAILKWAAYGGLAAALVSLAGAVTAGKRRRLGSVILAVVGIAVGLPIFVVPFGWALKARRVPAIHDITTDAVKPPQFVAILPLRKDAPNPAEYGGAEIAIRQRAGYPDIQPLLLNVSQPQAFDQALAAARDLGWRIVAEVPDEGRIEASDTTFWFGFTDDIVVRVAAADHRTLVDVRSVSRVGRSDVGTNAERIRRYLQRVAAGR